MDGCSASIDVTLTMAPRAARRLDGAGLVALVWVVSIALHTLRAALPERTIVNCTGYGARALFGDELLIPVRGQIARLVPQPEVDAFLKEMKDAGTDCTFVAYNGVLHAFTDPTANAPAFGAAYDEKAAKRSWAHMADFFKETLGA